MNKTIMMSIGAALVLATSALPSFAVDGEDVFKKCRVCHSIEDGKMKVGPSLYGVVGRTPGTLTGYKYSASMIAFGETGAVWDAATLNTYLTKPRDLVTKTKMIFPGLNDEVTGEADRLAVIAYLDGLDD